MDISALSAKMDSKGAATALAVAIAALSNISGPQRLPLLLVIARGHGITGAPVDALRAALEARALAIECGDVKAEAEALLVAGAAHQRVDEHAAAIAYFEQAEQLIAAIDDENIRHLHHGLLRRMGVSCSMLGRHELALNYITRSIDILGPDAPAQDRMSSRNSLINAHSRRIDAAVKKNPAEGAAYAALLPDIAALAADAEREGCQRIADLALSNYGTMLVTSGQYEAGIERLRHAFDTFTANGMRADQGAAMGAIGNAYLKLGQFERAVDAYRQALVFLDGGSITFQRDAWDGTAAAYEGLDEPREALAAYKRARALEQRLIDSTAVANLEQHELRSGMKQVTAELSRLADEDALTGLQNRRAAERKLRDVFSGRSAAPTPPISVLFIDLDHFKHINDHFGHAMGDDVLRECARLMRQASRAADIAARWGGEEFILILIDADRARAGEVAERLRDAIAKYDWAQRAPGLKVTCSIGLAAAVECDSPRAETLLALADARLYRAKESGRNRVTSA
jgi:diguanylate cyclase (GGDEF)-like protein